MQLTIHQPPPKKNIKNEIVSCVIIIPWLTDIWSLGWKILSSLTELFESGKKA